MQIDSHSEENKDSEVTLRDVAAKLFEEKY